MIESKPFINHDQRLAESTPSCLRTQRMQRKVLQLKKCRRIQKWWRSINYDGRKKAAAMAKDQASYISYYGTLC